MAITQALCTSFKKELLEGKHDFSVSGGHTFKIALYSAGAALSAGTTSFTTTGEVVGAGYTSGGIDLTNKTATSSGTVGFTSFDDATFSNASLSVRGALIYNSTTDGGSGTTNAICVLDFSADKTTTANDFIVGFPTADSSTAIIRFD
tara:strand:+ start:2240 stop:2683 length:444 start_codon:yes stop_codon:yes gene_type:complete